MNLVKGAKVEAKKGKLAKALLFLCINNSMVKGGAAKGNLSSSKLFELIVDLNEYSTFVLGYQTSVNHFGVCNR